jgi:ribosomal protein S27E
MPIFENEEKEILSGNASYEGKKGILTLTSKRIIFESQSGIFYKKGYSNLELPVAMIEKIEVGGYKGRNICIKMKKGFMPIRCEIAVVDSNNWSGMIQKAVQGSKEKEPESRAKGPSEEKGNEELLAMQCPVCGAPLVFFDENEKVICQYCRTWVVYEKK